MNKTLRNTQKMMYFTLVFMGGFHVMALEMCAFRSLTTNFGSSIYVTGILLTLVMIALSVGYSIGGRLSKNGTDLLPLIYVLLATSAYLNITSGYMSDAILNWTYELRKHFSARYAVNTVPPAISIVILYVLPMIGLATISPFIIKLLTASIVESRSVRDEVSGRVGLTVGNLMAVSTLGSIIGTLVATYITIIILGVRSTIFLITLSAIIVTLSCLIMKKMLSKKSVAATLISIASLGVYLLPEKLPDDVIAFENSAYGNIRAHEDRDSAGERFRYIQTVRGYFDSQIYIDDPLLEQRGLMFLSYTELFHAKRILILGIAGGSAIIQMRALNPEADITAVDIDPATIRIAKKAFGVIEDERTKLVEDDGRMFLKSTTDTYDYVLLDIFKGDHTPVHCTTQEFYSLILSRLNPGGILLVNSNMSEIESDHEEDLPKKHLQSTIFHAGFASLYYDDFFNNQGFMWAFRDRMPLSDLLSRLYVAIHNEKLSVRLRANFAVSYLRIIEVNERVKNVRPFTDKWTPEALIQKRFSMNDYLRSVTAGSKLGSLRDSMSDPSSGADLQEVLLKSVITNMKDDGRFEIDAASYCKTASDWYSKGDSKRDQLAKFFWPAYCFDHIKGNQVLSSYLNGLDLAARSWPDKALGDLIVAVEQLSGNGAE